MSIFFRGGVSISTNGKVEKKHLEPRKCFKNFSLQLLEVGNWAKKHFLGVDRVSGTAMVNLGVQMCVLVETC